MNGSGWEIRPMGILVITVIAGLTIYLIVKKYERRKEDRRR
jgi:hypothetical protein